MIVKVNKVIIVDIDGTLSDCQHRLHFINGEHKDWDAFYSALENDKPIEQMRWLMRIIDMGCGNMMIGSDVNFVFCTGRPEKYRNLTVKWLIKNIDECFCPDSEDDEGGETWPKLLMRKDGDFRADDIIKQEMLDSLKAKGYEILFAIDDRKRVADMYRKNGVICLQCADGDF